MEKKKGEKGGGPAILPPDHEARGEGRGGGGNIARVYQKINSGLSFKKKGRRRGGPERFCWRRLGEKGEGKKREKKKIGVPLACHQSASEWRRDSAAASAVQAAGRRGEKEKREGEKK